MSNLGISREAFLKRVCATLGHDSNRLIPIPPRSGSDELIRLTRRDDDLTAVFTQRAVAMGMVVHKATPDSLALVIQSLLAGMNAKKVVLDMPAYPINLIRDALRDRQNVVEPVHARNLDVQFNCDVGITGVVGVIAETGTLVLSSDKSRSRGTFLIPPVHIAVMLDSQIAADMIDFMAFASHYVKPPVSSALTFVTGPSKTADIEGILITGVHGPRAVHVVLLETPDS